MEALVPRLGAAEAGALVPHQAAAALVARAQRLEAAAAAALVLHLAAAEALVPRLVAGAEVLVLHRELATAEENRSRLSPMWGRNR